MTILVFGKSGQVATALGRREDVICLGRDEADLLAPETCAEAIRAHGPAAVINAAAYTNVDGAETDEETALAVNGRAPGAIAATCRDLGIPLVHISTDYVFDGSGKAPWTPEDRVAPISAYGRTKLAGEKAVIAAGGTHVILRTSWVFSETGKNFVKTILRLAAERDRLTIVADQVGGPTAAEDIAAATHKIAGALVAAPEKAGIYHFSGAPDVTWADFARAITRLAGSGAEVADIATRDFPLPAKRPANSRLDCGSLEREFGIVRPDWMLALTQVVKKLQEQEND